MTLRLGNVQSHFEMSLNSINSSNDSVTHFTLHHTWKETMTSYRPLTISLTHHHASVLQFRQPSQPPHIYQLSSHLSKQMYKDKREKKRTQERKIKDQRHMIWTRKVVFIIQFSHALSTKWRDNTQALQAFVPKKNHIIIEPRPRQIQVRSERIN